MATYDKQTTLLVARDLIETARRIVAAVESGPDDSPQLEPTCAALGRALSEIRTVVY